MSEFINLDIISMPEAALRIILALAFGAMLGLERDQKDKPIDFKAYMIVAITTTMIAIMGQELYHTYASEDNGVVLIDLSKIISGTLTGMGFLGAGAIMKREDKKVLHGTATGASIWAAGGIGLCLGFGEYGLAAIAFTAIFLVMLGGGILSKTANKVNHK